jgi:hypothetical protein
LLNELRQRLCIGDRVGAEYLHDLPACYYECGQRQVFRRRGGFVHHHGDGLSNSHDRPEWQPAEWYHLHGQRQRYCDPGRHTGIRHRRRLQPHLHGQQWPGAECHSKLYTDSVYENLPAAGNPLAREKNTQHYVKPAPTLALS